MTHDAEGNATPEESENGLVLTITYEPAEANMEDVFGLSEQTLWRVAALTLERVGITTPVEISALVTDDEGLRELNREYRGRDEATDVLSFPLLDAPLVEAPANELWQPSENGGGPDRGHTVFLDSDDTGDAAGHIFGGALDLDDETLEELEADEAEDIADEAEDTDEDDAEPPLVLGDIALSRDAIARQAVQAGHSPAWEFAYLLAHGVLHLVGYDDHTEAGYRAMVAHQEAVLQSIGIDSSGDQTNV